MLNKGASTPGALRMLYKGALKKDVESPSPPAAGERGSCTEPWSRTRNTKELHSHKRLHTFYIRRSRFGQTIYQSCRAKRGRTGIKIKHSFVIETGPLYAFRGAKPHVCMKPPPPPHSAEPRHPSS